VKLAAPPLPVCLAALALASVGAGAWLLSGPGVALLSVGGLLWLDLTLAGIGKKGGGKP
jgi:hypothetical protein